MAEPPGQAQQPRATAQALLFVQEQGRYGGQMIGIQGMPEAKNQRNDQWESHWDIIPCPRSEITDIVASRRIDSRP